MLERLDTLLWDAEASAIRDLEQTDKSLLEELFQEAFSQKLNRHCASCWQDAYWQLRWLRKKLKQTPTRMPLLTKYKIVQPFMFIFVRGLGVIRPEEMTDELCEKALAADPDFAKHVEPVAIEIPVETPTPKRKKA